MVEFWRDPGNKESSGWRGPAELAQVDHSSGNVHIKWQSRVLICRQQYVRASLLSWLMTPETSYGKLQVGLQHVIDFVNDMKEGTMHVGYACDESQSEHR